KVGQVLLHQQCGRSEHRHLLAGLCGNERRAHGDFGLAEADVAAHDAIHGALAAQVGEHLLDRLRLILGLLEREGVGEGLVVGLADRQCESLLGLAPRLRRRSWRARAPNSCASAITAIGGAVSVRPSRSGATVSASRAVPATNASQPGTMATWWRCARSISCSTSRRPAESAGRREV